MVHQVSQLASSLLGTSIDLRIGAREAKEQTVMAGLLQIGVQRARASDQEIRGQTHSNRRGLAGPHLRLGRSTDRSTQGAFCCLLHKGQRGVSAHRACGCSLLGFLPRPPAAAARAHVKPTADGPPAHLRNRVAPPLPRWRAAAPQRGRPRPSPSIEDPQHTLHVVPCQTAGFCSPVAPWRSTASWPCPITERTRRALGDDDRSIHPCDARAP